MTLKSMLLSTTLILSASAAAAITPEQVISAFQNQGFTAAEVKSGPTQIKVEAVRDDLKLEVIYDRETGTILSQERSRADANDAAGGWEFSRSDVDFISGDDGSDHNGSDDHGSDDDGSDNDGSDDNGSDDDGSDDNGSDDGGSDDGGSDDGGSDDGGSDDDGSDDDGGRKDDRSGGRGDRGGDDD